MSRPLTATIVLLTLTAASALQPAPHVRPALRPAARAVLVASEPVAAVGTARSFSASWGVLGVIGILAKAIKRLAPHAVQPLVQRDLTLLQWGLYGTSLTFFAYVEGYKAFQCKFSPLVVQRAMTLAAPGAPVGHRVAAPFYSMGLFHATPRRRNLSWSISLGVAAIIGVVKRLPYPWRSVVDAGVCVGLGWGCASMAVLFARALAGTPPGADPCLPQ